MPITFRSVNPASSIFSATAKHRLSSQGSTAGLDSACATEVACFGPKMEPVLDRLHSYLARDAPNWNRPIPCNFTYSGSAGPNRPFLISRFERAILEVTGGPPSDRLRFHSVYMPMENIHDLYPNRLQELLRGCCSIDVMRMSFLWTAANGIG